MTTGIWFLCLFLTAFGCWGQNEPESTRLKSRELPADSLLQYVKYRPGVRAFTHARIINGTGSPVLSDQTLLVDHGRILFVGSGSEVDIPGDAEIVDLTGKTVIPGMVGMHNHLHIPGHPDVGNVAAKLYLACGVTTIQTCGSAMPARELELSGEIRAGQRIGPEIIPSAPYITGPGGNPGMIIPRNEQHLRDTMQYWIDQGVTWFKVYRHITPDDLQTTIQVAHENNGKVRGHLCSVTFEEASAWGIDGIEHGLNSAADFRTDKEYGVCNGGRTYMDELEIDSPEVQRLQEIMLKNRVILTSTLSVYESGVPNRVYAEERELSAMSPELEREYRERRARSEAYMNDSTRNHRLRRIMQFEYRYFRMGGLLCSGADAGRHVLPGFGDQRNYLLLAESGYTAEEAVQISTGNGATALGRDDIGTIQAGRRADFAIINGDLKEDPQMIRQIEVVFKDGVGYDPSAILESVHNRFGSE